MTDICSSCFNSKAIGLHTLFFRPRVFYDIIATRKVGLDLLIVRRRVLSERPHETEIFPVICYRYAISMSYLPEIKLLAI